MQKTNIEEIVEVILKFEIVCVCYSSKWTISWHHVFQDMKNNVQTLYKVD